MAITSTITINSDAVSQEDGGIPDGYTIPVISDPANAEPHFYEHDVAITEANADPVTGITNVVAAVKAHFDGTQGPSVLKLNTTLAITASLRILAIKRVNDVASIFSPGTEVFRCTVKALFS